MKLRWIAAIGVLTALGCGEEPHGVVVFTGTTPLTPFEKDSRGVQFSCPKCGIPVEFGAQKCPNNPKKCKTKLKWASEYTCTFCGGTGNCRACFMFDQKDGKCYNCRGEGFIVFQGKTKPCGDCKGTGKCTICAKNPGKCDFCLGLKKVGREQIEALVKRTAPAVAEEEKAPPEEKEPPEEKKPEEKPQ